MSFKKIIHILFTNVISLNIWLLVILTGGIIFGVLHWISVYTHHNQAIEVPDLKGLQPEEAELILKKKDLRLQIADSVYSKNVAPGSVVEMIPPAGSKVKQNRIVFLTINAKTSQTVEVPDMFEISQRQAEATLRSLGFVIDSIEYVPYQYKGLVINILNNGNIVEPGKRLPMGSHLWLQVGDGFEQKLDSDSLETDSNETNLDLSFFDE